MIVTASQEPRAAVHCAQPGWGGMLRTQREMLNFSAGRGNIGAFPHGLTLPASLPAAQRAWKRQGKGLSRGRRGKAGAGSGSPIPGGSGLPEPISYQFLYFRSLTRGRRDAGAPFVLHLFPFTESLCLCLPMPSGCSKTTLPLVLSGLDSWEEPGEVFRCSGCANAVCEFLGSEFYIAKL